MYAVVQIGSRILRSPMGMKRSVPPRFGVWASAGVASVPAASAAVPVRKSRRVRWLIACSSSGSAPEIVLERGKRLGRELVRGQALPVPLGDGAPETLGLRLRLGEQRGLVQADDVAALDHAATVDDDLGHV